MLFHCFFTKHPLEGIFSAESMPASTCFPGSSLRACFLALWPASLSVPDSLDSPVLHLPPMPRTEKTGTKLLPLSPLTSLISPLPTMTLNSLRSFISPFSTSAIRFRWCPLTSCSRCNSDSRDSMVAWRQPLRHPIAIFLLPSPAQAEASPFMHDPDGLCVGSTDPPEGPGGERGQEDKAQGAAVGGSHTLNISAKCKHSAAPEGSNGPFGGRGCPEARELLGPSRPLTTF